MKGKVFIMSLAQAINLQDVEKSAPSTAKKLMLLLILCAWVAAIVLSIMFICLGYNGYTKDPEIKENPKIPGQEEGSSLMQEEEPMMA